MIKTITPPMIMIPVVEPISERSSSWNATTLLCVAEVDEAFAAHVEEIEIVEDAKAQNRKAEGAEAVQLGNGHQRVVVIRW